MHVLIPTADVGWGEKRQKEVRKAVECSKTPVSNFQKEN